MGVQFEVFFHRRLETLIDVHTVGIIQCHIDQDVCRYRCVLGFHDPQQCEGISQRCGLSRDNQNNIVGRTDKVRDIPATAGGGINNQVFVVLFDFLQRGQETLLLTGFKVC